LSIIKKMTGRTNTSGQTLIETALVLMLLLIILLGLAEFARAWFTKSSLKSGVRSGARLAVVTPSITEFTNTPCPNADAIVNAVCTSPGVKNDVNTSVSVDVVDNNPPAASGDVIKVSAQTVFTFIVGGPPWPWPTAIYINADSSMRYE
jgi:Flp pilus assembly protein TadG